MKKSAFPLLTLVLITVFALSGCNLIFPQLGAPPESRPYSNRDGGDENNANNAGNENSSVNYDDCEHIDSNDDYICDICGYCDHYDDDGDRICDICGRKIECEHYDEDNDGTCDKCGESFTKSPLKTPTIYFDEEETGMQKR